MPDFRLKWFYGIVYVLLPISIVLLTLFLLRHLRFRRYGFVTTQYVRLRNVIKNKGARITLSSTPSEVKREAIQLGMDGQIAEFIRLYEEYRFGGKKIRGEDRVRYQRLINEIKKTK